jgi:hypothetical protein
VFLFGWTAIDTSRVVHKCLVINVCNDK